MNDQFEQLIHDGIDRLTADSKFPAELASRARRQVRRRQHQVRAGLAAGVAATAAIAVIAATSAGSAGTTKSIAANPSASVVLLAKVERAVASKAADRPVLQVRTNFHQPSRYLVPEQFSPIPVFGKGITGQTVWSRGNVAKINLVNSKGQTVAARRSVGAGQVIGTTEVDYGTRSWWRDSLRVGLVNANPPCLLLPEFGYESPRDWTPARIAARIRHVVKCGQVKVVGRQRVDGVDAIKLTFWPKSRWKSGTKQYVAYQTLWVDPTSYLPVRSGSTELLIAPKSKPKVITWTRNDFRWLPASRATLAKLRLTVPAGFHHTSGPGLCIINARSKAHDCAKG